MMTLRGAGPAGPSRKKHTTPRAPVAGEWDTIRNPLTGEVLTFVERGAHRCVFDLTLPSGRVPVVTHRHPGVERFDVRDGHLRLMVDGVARDLGPGEGLEVHARQFHAPTNDFGAPVLVRVTCTPYGHFAERGVRMAFGAARDGRVRPDGRPRDLLTLALGSERGRFQIAGPPTVLWRLMMTLLGAVAVLAGRRRVLDSYWPDDLPRPWRR